MGGRKAEAERNDQLVLAAATEVFLEQGFDAPMSAIAERAGVGMGSLYRRYRSKEELARRLCADSMERVAVAAEEALAQQDDGWSALVAFMRAAVRGGAGALSEFAGEFPVTRDLVELSQRAAASMQAIVDKAEREGAIRPGVTAGDLTMMCKMLRAKTMPMAARAEELRLRYLAALLDGLRHSSTPLPGAGPEWPEIAARWGRPVD